MIRIFIYGELVSKRNLQLVIDSPIKLRCEDARLLGHQLATTDGSMAAVKEAQFHNVNGLLYYMDEDQVKTLMNYYGAGFRLATGTVKVGGIESPAKYMLCTSTNYVGRCDKAQVEQRILAFSSLYTDNDNERKYVDGVIQALFPDKSVEWIASNFPYYVRWLRSVGYDSDYMLNMVETEDAPTDSDVIRCLLPVFSNVSTENIKSIVLYNTVATTLNLDIANSIAHCASVLKGDVFDVKKSLSDAGISVSGIPDIEQLDSNYETLKKYCDAVKDMDTSPVCKRMFVLLALRKLHLPLVALSDIDSNQLNAYVMNEMYIDNLLEE